MTRRAIIRSGDLNRYLKAAKEHGFAVVISGDEVKLLPRDGGADVTSDQTAEEQWDKALGLQ